MRSVIARYGRSAARVVPGHGAAGGTELLTHTLELAEGAPSPPRTNGFATLPNPIATNPVGTTPNPPPPTRPECVFDDARKRACDARGPGFTYGPSPVIYCSGVAPPPGQEQAAYEASRRGACVCIDEAAVAARRHECSRIPSAPPRPSGGPAGGGD